MSGDPLATFRPEVNPAAPLAGTPLCRRDELPDPGSHGFSWEVGGRVFKAFLIHLKGQVFGYVDVCPHAGWPLVGAGQQYLNSEASAVICRVHGASFIPENGHWINVPDVEGLITWPVEVRSDDIIYVA